MKLKAFKLQPFGYSSACDLLEPLGTAEPLIASLSVEGIHQGTKTCHDGKTFHLLDIHRSLSC